MIKETFRFFPPVPIMGRKISEDCVIGGCKIPKDTDCIVYIFAVHKDERYFPDPEKFDPDRFTPENSKDRHPFAYIPFSAGRRNWIGQRFAIMEIKVILANMLRKFEIKSLKTVEELEPVAELVLKPAYGIPVKLSVRTKEF